jgi:hypothetical protein
LVDATRPTPLGTVTVAEPTPVEDAVDAVPDTRVVADVAEEALDLAPIASDAPMHDSASDALSELAADAVHLRGDPAQPHVRGLGERRGARERVPPTRGEQSEGVQRLCV